MRPEPALRVVGERGALARGRPGPLADPPVGVLLRPLVEVLLGLLLRLRVARLLVLEPVLQGLPLVLAELLVELLLGLRPGVLVGGVQVPGLVGPLLQLLRRRGLRRR